MNANLEQFKNALTSGNKQLALDTIASVQDYLDAEGLVKAALYADVPDPELVDTTLEKFLACRAPTDPIDSVPEGCRFVDAYEKRFNHHGGWVHSLSHFMDTLWTRRMDGWIRRLNEVALCGGGMQCFNCCERIIGSFLGNSGPNDRPQDFGLAPENMQPLKTEVLSGKTFSSVRGYLVEVFKKLITEIEKRTL